jgi:hypothetical protein
MSLNSRDISLLRSDVAANCRLFVQKCAEAGYKVLVTGTVRDDAFQLECYKKGTAKTKVPSFHSVKAGLAFDICQNVKGKEYNDNAFWAAAGAIGQEMGFEWGGSWKFTDKPHFQWSDGGKYTSSMIVAGKYPPTMPLCAQNSDVTSVANKLGLSDPSLWQRGCSGAETVSGGDYGALFGKVCAFKGQPYTDVNVVAVFSTISGITSPETWQNVIDGKVTASAAYNKALFAKINAAL